MLTVIDEHSRECLAIHVQRQLKSDDVLAVLAGLFVTHGPPAHIRSDNVLSQERRRESRQYASVHASMGLRDLFCQLLRTRTSLNSTPLATFTLQAASTGEGSSRP